MAFTWNEDGHHVEDGRVLIGDDAMRQQRMMPLDEEVPEGWHYVTETEISHLADEFADSAIEGLLKERAADSALRN
jgi:hypothetical protein